MGGLSPLFSIAGKCANASQRAEKGKRRNCLNAISPDPSVADSQKNASVIFAFFDFYETVKRKLRCDWKGQADGMGLVVLPK
jgi:hypothetical protein